VYSYGIALLIGLLIYGPVWREWRLAGWGGAVLILAAGWANLGYVLAMLEGEVMRVLLLFYLAPLWTVLLARLLLGERLNRHGYGVIALSLSGALVMLWQPEAGWPLPQNAAEWMGLTAGMSFALTNVLVRRADQLSIEFKSACIWFGSAALTLIAMLALGQGGNLRLVTEWWWLLGLLGIVLCATSLIVQFGLSNLSATRAIVLLLFELVFAAVASWLLADEAMGLRETLGALLIASASLLSGRMHPND
jgi:drug/metabolite transporter (DMT)-like permease